jgi:imidazolonepropionase-like amidohydrolase
MITILENAAVADVDAGIIIGERSIVIEDGVIREIVEEPARSAHAHSIDLRGLTLMPGLIDCHVHTMQSTSNLEALSRESPFYAAGRAFEILRGMLDRGFTTVRDCGGADFGLAKAVREGTVPGPEIIYCGKALTATGGHGDYRKMGQYADDDSYYVPKLSRRAEGVADLRRAVRDEVRKGAHHIKIMANGGVASPTDRITSDQYSEDEIRAVVDEAAMADLYVAAHTYTARSIQRAVRNGVRTVEHGNLADQATLDLMEQHGAFLVPTLIIFRALAEEGVADGLPADLAGKLGNMMEEGQRVVEMAYRSGIPMAYGTDLIGSGHRRQLEEFVLRADLVPAADLVRSATVVGARLIRRENELGRVAAGYRADLIAVSGNPLENIRVLADPVANLKFVMKAGRVVKSEEPLGHSAARRAA